VYPLTAPEMHAANPEGYDAEEEREKVGGWEEDWAGGRPIHMFPRPSIA
jgi:hypothetical protein